eukprot:509721-Rhodomonas_salina.1
MPPTEESPPWSRTLSLRPRCRCRRRELRGWGRWWRGRTRGGRCPARSASASRRARGRGSRRAATTAPTAAAT